MAEENSVQEVNNKENRVRLKSLSKPKIYAYQQTKWISEGPTVKWGTQEMLTPPSDAAKSATATVRLQELARPKTDKTINPGIPQFYYSCGRESQINLTREAAQHATCTVRLEQLAKHKEILKQFTEQHRDQYTYSCGRVSPIWPVGESSTSAAERTRTNDLAKYKPYHKDYLPERVLPWELAPAAKSAQCSDRVSDLAKHKLKNEDQFREPMWEVTLKARKAAASPRVLELSRSKPVYDGHQLNFDHGAGAEVFPKLIRLVTRNAKNAVASARTKELATPIIRQSMDLVQFNPEAFIIKPSALKARCSNRITELAEPLVRAS